LNWGTPGLLTGVRSAWAAVIYVGGTRPGEMSGGGQPATDRPDQAPASPDRPMPSI